MSTLESSGLSLRGYGRRKAVLDLNVPLCEVREDEGTSQQVGLGEVTGQPIQLGLGEVIGQPIQLGLGEVTGQPIQLVPPATIDDDVIESSATAFAEAKFNSRRSRARTVIDVDSGRPARSTNYNQNKRRRVPPSQIVIHCDHYINLESSPQSLVKEIIKPQPPTSELTFDCPICMGSLTEEMSTRCGHIFCKACIKAAIAAQGKCPTCRKKVTLKELIRVFLPSAS